MHRWEDGTVGYLFMNVFANSPPLCGNLDSNLHLRLESCGMKGAKKVLCEEEGSPDKFYSSQYAVSERRRIPMSEPTNAAVHFKHTVCPSGYLTHSFLACDPLSACWQNGNLGQSNTGASTNRKVASMCLSTLSTLFTCTTNTERVPYSLVCDNNKDCLDASDEDFCTYPSCSSSSHFKCTNDQVRINKDSDLKAKYMFTLECSRQH